MVERRDVDRALRSVSLGVFFFFNLWENGYSKFWASYLSARKFGVSFGADHLCSMVEAGTCSISMLVPR